MVFQTHPGALTQPPACVQIIKSHHEFASHAHNVKSMQVRKENRCLKNGQSGRDKMLQKIHSH